MPHLVNPLDEDNSMTAEHEHAEAEFRATLLGTFYPNNSVVAVFDDAQDAEQAVSDLQKSGVAAGDIRMVSGDEVLQAATEQDWTQQGGLRGLVGRVQRILSEEGHAQIQYLEEARNGHHFVLVRVHEEPAVKQIQEALHTRHAHHMKYFSQLAIEDLM